MNLFEVEPRLGQVVVQNKFSEQVHEMRIDFLYKLKEEEMIQVERARS